MLLSELWEFVSSNEFDVWESRILEFDPESIIDNYHSNFFDEYKILKKENVVNLRMMLNQSKTQLAQIISGVIEIGRGNLYGGTGEYSNWTLIPLLEILNLMDKEYHQSLNLTRFEESRFSESNGWGNPINKSFFS